MNLQLKDTKITNMILSSSSEGAGSDPIQNLEFSPGYFEESDTEFVVRFKISLITEEDISLKIDFEALFGTDEPLTSEFKDSHFPRVNAPAIAYPFLRSAISNTLLQAGYQPIILPAINFTRAVRVEEGS